MKKFRVYYRRLGVARRSECMVIEAESKADALAVFTDKHNKTGWLTVTAVFG